jgi:hypothetical protein
VQKTVGTKDTVMRITEKTQLWGMPALELIVTSVGTDEVYFVENEWDIADHAAYDETLYCIDAGTLVRMHRPLIGESLILTVTEAFFNSMAIGDKVAPAAGGVLVMHV